MPKTIKVAISFYPEHRIASARMLDCFKEEPTKEELDQKAAFSSRFKTEVPCYAVVEFSDFCIEKISEYRNLLKIHKLTTLSFYTCFRDMPSQHKCKVVFLNKKEEVIKSPTYKEGGPKERLAFPEDTFEIDLCSFYSTNLGFSFVFYNGFSEAVLYGYASEKEFY